MGQVRNALSAWLEVINKWCCSVDVSEPDGKAGPGIWLAMPHTDWGFLQVSPVQLKDEVAMDLTKSSCIQSGTEYPRNFGARRP